MSQTSENNKRIVKNTIALYIRTLVTMAVGLFTSRVVLNVLGIEDYGVYNVVGGVVSMFTIVTASLSQSISRYLTFELGKGNRDKLRTIFCTSVNIQLLMSLVVIVLMECIGIWFLNTKMNIDADRMYAANWVFQFSVLTFVINLISVPYNASIVSHEHMRVFAYIGMASVIANLLIVIVIANLPDGADRLIYYSTLLSVVGLMFQGYYWLYCRKHFEECRFSLQLEKPLLKEMMGFAGWNFIGASSAVLRDQGGNIVLNLFWGTTLNAARGIAQQVSNAIGGFVGNFMTALNPQITKSYASGEREYMMKLIFRAARFSFYLLFILSMPVLFNTDYLINLWLGQVPAHVVLYVRLILVFSLCETVSNPLITVMLATGNIRNYQIIVGGLQMMNLPISYVLLRMGFFPEIIAVVAIAISICCLVARLVMLRAMIGLPVRLYIRKVLFNLLVVIVLALLLPGVVFTFNCDTFLYFICSCFICVLSAALSVYLLGCSSGERNFIREKAKQFIARLIHI